MNSQSGSPSAFPNVTTTATLSDDSSLLRITRDEKRRWLISDDVSTVWGLGDTLLEAFSDFHAALRSHLDIMDRDTITPRLQAQKRRILWLLERGGVAL